MRVWLVDDRNDAAAGGLEGTLKQLAAQPEGAVRLLGVRPFWPDFAGEMRNQLPDVIVLHEPAWPDGPWTNDLLDLGMGIVVAGSCERFRGCAEVYPVVFIPSMATPECLLLALVGACAARRRHEYWKTQVNRLQQRLSDRIIIERAKGVLVQRMGITEEEAYNRLRVLSRRQRRQIRDIAQSLLDTEALFLPGVNGTSAPAVPDNRTTAEKQPNPPA